MTPTAELLTKVFSLLERARCQIGCECEEPGKYCMDCKRLKYDIDGLLDNDTQGERP